MALICADTTFLIDLRREVGCDSGPVQEFLRSHISDEFAISLTALGEFAAGFADLANPISEKAFSVKFLAGAKSIIAILRGFRKIAPHNYGSPAFFKKAGGEFLSTRAEGNRQELVVEKNFSRGFNCGSSGRGHLAGAGGTAGEAGGLGSRSGGLLRRGGGRGAKIARVAGGHSSAHRGEVRKDFYPDRLQRQKAQALGRESAGWSGRSLEFAPLHGGGIG